MKSAGELDPRRFGRTRPPVMLLGGLNITRALGLAGIPVIVATLGGLWMLGVLAAAGAPSAPWLAGYSRGLIFVGIAVAYGLMLLVIGALGALAWAGLPQSAHSRVPVQR